MSFAFSSSVTIDFTKCGGSDSANFPVLFNTIDNRFKTVGNGGHVQNASGFDVRPYADSGLTSALSYELERFNATTGEVIMWVKLPTVSHTVNTVFYMAYGDATISTDGSSAANTFSSSFSAVWHLKDGTTLSANDALGSFNMFPANSPAAVAGQIDGGVGLVSASSQKLETGSNGPAAPAFTISAWIKSTTFNNGYVVDRGFASSDYYALTVTSTGLLSYDVAATSIIGASGPTVMSTGVWYYIAVTYDSVGGLKGYLNGVAQNSAAANGVANTSGVASAIGYNRAVTGNYFNGSIDEVRYASVARSIDWLLTEFNNQNSPSTFYSLGSESGGVSPSASRGFFRLVG